MSIWSTLGEVAVGTVTGGAIAGPGGAIIGGAAGLGDGDVGQGLRDAGGWLVNTLSDTDCLVCKTNPIWWETVAAVAAARAAGIIKTPDDCAVYAQKGDRDNRHHQLRAGAVIPVRCFRQVRLQAGLRGHRPSGGGCREDLKPAGRIVRQRQIDQARTDFAGLCQGGDDHA